jgi:predicted nucleotide-binding protein (sugar kinase/HSP70/actin superfamily)
VIKTYIKNGKLCGNFTKEFTLISNRSVSVPEIKFKEFNGTKTVEVKTNKIFINIVNGHHKTNNVQKEIVKNKIIYKTKTDFILMVLVFIIGIIVGILGSYFIKFKTAQNNDTIKKIKKANEKELFNILLEFSNHPEIEKILKKLEENIYNNAKHKINKKEIIKIIKKITQK